MNIFDEFQSRLAAIIERLGREGALPPGLDTGKVVVESPRDASHGDLATNAAMVLAKEAKSNPRALAERIAAALAEDPDVVSAEVAGPGFINIRLEGAVFRRVVAACVAQGRDFGRVPRSGAERVNVEYVSANPTGPMHVGHGRGAVFGDALANLLAFAGEDVAREYYINDAGAQVDVLARSAYLRYREALGETVSIPEGLYPGDYLKPVGEALARAHGDALLTQDEAQWLPLVRQTAIDMMMDMIRADLAALDIRHDVFFSERSLSSGPVDRIRETIDDLRSRDLVYEGRLAPPKGQPVEDWEDREQTLFRATAFGDDVDRPLLKSDGSYTYFASDIAYHASKFARGFAVMIDVWGADHGGYVKRMNAAVKAVTAGRGVLDVKLCQLVRLLRNGEPVKMSKRAGEFVTLRDVVDEVGRDAVRFMMLFRKNDATLDFDLAKVIEQSKDNPVFYVQYAHARCHSVFRQAAAAFGPVSDESLASADLSVLSDSGELDVIRRLAQFPRQIEAAAAAHEPHRIAFYLYDLASEFHALWNKGKEAPHLRFVIETDQMSSYARLALVKAVMSVLASGLAILGVAAPEEMR
ncbi:arginine--tRNA ligase [Alsobacter sp. SYSU M60028]|uniref:Arginine--tRNA ligase n=1 Tax=Alsobacter ponti TaxID=2962936 RepID=A0ABT1LCX4_9HYPH|nr:arginine--tRNA ligase [Alsobacter ponti]MCP8939355.1 arginine--tRNA ligase [Alsobacter ponti]